MPQIAEALARLRVSGEGVVCRADGATDFDRLRAAVGSARVMRSSVSYLSRSLKEAASSNAR